HHLSASRQVLGVVVSGSNGVLLCMSKLPLDCVGIPALLVQPRRCHATETVPGHLILRVSQPTQGCVDGVLAHRALGATDSGEYVPASSGDGMQLAQNSNSLLRERDDVLHAHLHA